jgi:hypothetical protein
MAPSAEGGKKTALLSFIGLSQGDDVPIASALRIDNNHGTASKETKTDESELTTIPTLIPEFKGRTCENDFGIKKVQAALLQDSQPLPRIKADRQAGSAG